MAFKIFGLLAFAAVAGAQSGIGYYGQHLQKQVEVQPEYSYQQQPQVQEQEELQYQPQTQVYQEQTQQVQIQQQQIQIQQVQPQQVHYQPQQQQKHYHHHEEEHHAPAHYQFTYGVHDDHTGDVHGQQESRSGDKTEGQYYLIDADGHKRIVTYQVHGKSGFVAQVQREPIKGYQAPQQHQQHYQQQHHHHQEQQQQQQEYY
ncbi:G-box-binding factor [Culex quinquefasciatus]|uniref:G-box-binding factor n=1 Tax=Culex quinquefasciatus TaxID=7176 RepID=UPI0018E2BBC6|nr:G-box-binding factor [Culex quinquefasciatus]